jgi:hypothetical protein
MTYMEIRVDPGTNEVGGSSHWTRGHAWIYVRWGGTGIENTYGLWKDGYRNVSGTVVIPNNGPLTDVREDIEMVTNRPYRFVWADGEYHYQPLWHSIETRAGWTLNKEQEGKLISVLLIPAPPSFPQFALPLTFPHTAGHETQRHPTAA